MNLATTLAPAGYDPSLFTSGEITVDDVAPISPRLTKVERPNLTDSHDDTETLEDAALAEGRSIEEIEQQALADELRAVALEVALQAIVDTCNDMLDPTIGFVREYRPPGGPSQAVKYIRLGFQCSTLKSAIRRLQARSLRLRRIADRMMAAASKTDTAKQEAPTNDGASPATRPSQTAVRPRDVRRVANA